MYVYAEDGFFKFSFLFTFIRSKYLDENGGMNNRVGMAAPTTTDRIESSVRPKLITREARMRVSVWRVSAIGYRPIGYRLSSIE